MFSDQYYVVDTAYMKLASVKPLDDRSDADTSYQTALEQWIDRNMNSYLFSLRYEPGNIEIYQYVCQILLRQEFVQFYRQYGITGLGALLCQPVCIKINQRYVQLAGYDWVKQPLAPFRYSLSEAFTRGRGAHFDMSTLSDGSMRHGLKNMLAHMDALRRHIEGLLCARSTDQSRQRCEAVARQLGLVDDTVSIASSSSEDSIVYNQVIYDYRDVEVALRVILCRLGVRRRLGSGYNRFVHNIMRNFVCLHKGGYVSAQVLMRGLQTGKGPRRAHGRAGGDEQRLYDEVIRERRLPQPRVVAKRCGSGAPAAVRQLRSYVDQAIRCAACVLGRLLWPVEEPRTPGGARYWFFGAQYTAALRAHMLAQVSFGYTAAPAESAPRYLARLAFVTKAGLGFRPIMDCSRGYNQRAQRLYTILTRYTRHRDIIHTAREACSHAHHCIADIRAAYDTIDQGLLFQIVTAACDLADHPGRVYNMPCFERTAHRYVWRLTTFVALTQQQLVAEFNDIIFASHFTYNGGLYRLTRGVPQGSILGPLFCHLYYRHVINETVQYSILQASLMGTTVGRIQIYIYVDDMIICGDDDATIRLFRAALAARLSALSGYPEPITDEHQWCSINIEDRIHEFRPPVRRAIPRICFSTVLQQLNFYQQHVRNGLRLGCAHEDFIKQVLRFNDATRELLHNMGRGCGQLKMQLKYRWFFYCRRLLRTAARHYQLSIYQYKQDQVHVLRDARRSGLLAGVMLAGYVERIIREDELPRDVLTS